MGFLDSLSKTLSSGVDRAKFEADKFQRTSRISGEVNNIKSQIDTNVRQLGERALELYQQGAITAPEIASLAQIIAQLRDQQTQKEQELSDAQSETFEVWQASQPQQQAAGASPGQQVPISNEPSSSIPSQSGASSSYSPPTGSESSSYGASPSYTPPTGDAGATAPSFTGRSYNLPESTDISGSGMINSSSVGSSSGEALPTPCPNCGYSVPGNAAFCPNCGNRITRV